MGQSIEKIEFQDEDSPTQKIETLNSFLDAAVQKVINEDRAARALSAPTSENSANQSIEDLVNQYAD